MREIFRMHEGQRAIDVFHFDKAESVVARHRVLRVKAGAIREKERTTVAQAVILREASRDFDVDVNFANHREKSQDVRTFVGNFQRETVLLELEVIKIRKVIQRGVDDIRRVLKLAKSQRKILRHDQIFSEPAVPQHDATPETVKLGQRAFYFLAIVVNGQIHLFTAPIAKGAVIIDDAFRLLEQRSHLALFLAQTAIPKRLREKFRDVAKDFFDIFRVQKSDFPIGIRRLTHPVVFFSRRNVVLDDIAGGGARVDLRRERAADVAQQEFDRLRFPGGNVSDDA